MRIKPNDFYRNEVEYWGHTPGNYNIDSSEIYNVYGYPSKDNENILSVKTAGEHTFDVEKKYENISYSVIVSLYLF